MSTAGNRYLDLIGELCFARLECELDGATLSQEREVGYVATLDSWWNQMSDDEQENVESVLAESVSAPEDLRTEDVEVNVGDQAGPRRELRSTSSSMR